MTRTRLIDETGIERFRGTQVGGGGSGPFTVARVPLAFDTPGITKPGDGVPLYTPTVGDMIALIMLHVTEAWDGATPTGYVLPLGADQTIGQVIVAGLDMTLVDVDEASTGDILNTNSAIAGDFLNETVLYPRFATTTPLAFKVDDNGPGGDSPGSGQGAGDMTLVILRAP